MLNVPQPGEGVLRVALAQIEAVPAVYGTRYPYDTFGEPAAAFSPSERVKEPTVSGLASHAVFHAPFKELNQLLRQSYFQWLRGKLAALLPLCRRYHADIVLFPEITIPAAVLPMLARFASENGVTVVAGSHYVSANDLGPYSDLGISLGGDDIGKNVSVVFGRGGVLGRAEKRVPSRFEVALDLDKTMVSGTGPLVLPEIPRLPGVKSAVCICNDYLNEASALRDEQKVNVFFVPAWTPQLSDFDDLARVLLRPQEMAGGLLSGSLTFLANCGTCGRSAVFGAVDRTNLDGGDGIALRPFGPGEEGLAIVDARPLMQRPGGRTGPQGNIMPLEVVATIPVVYDAPVLPLGNGVVTYVSVLRQLESATPSRRKALLQHIRRHDLAGLLGSNALRCKLERLSHVPGSENDANARRAATEAVVLDESKLSLKEWGYMHAFHVDQLCRVASLPNMPAEDAVEPLKLRTVMRFLQTTHRNRIRPRTLKRSNISGAVSEREAIEWLTRMGLSLEEIRTRLRTRMKQNDMGEDDISRLTALAHLISEATLERGEDQPDLEADRIVDVVDMLNSPGVVSVEQGIRRWLGSILRERNFDRIAAIERKGLALLRLALPVDSPIWDRVILPDRAYLLPRGSLDGEMILLIDDTVVTGDGMERAIGELIDRGAGRDDIYTAAYAVKENCDPGRQPDYVPVANLRCSPRIYDHIHTQLKEAFVRLAQPLDCDHVIYRVAVADLTPTELKEALATYGQPDPLLGDDPDALGAYEATVDNPSGCDAVDLELPRHISREGVRKVRFYLPSARPDLYVLPLHFAECSGDQIPGSADACAFSHDSAISLCRIAGGQNPRPQLCVDCGSLNLSVALARAFLPAFVAALRERHKSAEFRGPERSHLKLAYKPYGEAVHDRVTELLARG